ncbi:MAG: RNA signal recognition particle [Verrucomicrobiales bacterium]|nr:RNA signal recognition particle [Verrucomicrobiales bacterium]
MSEYVDGFVIPVPKENIEKYEEIATKAGEIWKEYGALDYRETLLDDPTSPDLVSFLNLAGAKEGETVAFSWITYESKEHRDSVNEKVMADPRINEMCGVEEVFDCKRMAYGGFETLVHISRNKI